MYTPKTWKRLLRDNELILVKTSSVCRVNLESKSWTKDLQQEEQTSPLKCDKNKQSVKPSTGNEHTFKKNTGTRNQQASWTQKYRGSNNNTRLYYSSHVVNVREITVENIVWHLGKDAASVTGKISSQQCVRLKVFYQMI